MRLEEITLDLYQEIFKNPIRMPTAAEVNGYAEALGFRFPEKYVSFIVKYAGHESSRDVGYAVVARSLRDETYAYMHDIGLFLHYDADRDYKYSVQNNRYFYVEAYGVRDFIPFTSTSVGGEIGFDFSESRIQPRIVNSNVYGGELDDDDLILRPVAASFDQFIDKLITEKEFEAKYGSMVI